MTSLSSKVRVARRFQKAIRVDADMTDIGALEGYICPPSATHILRQMANHVAETSQGAFTWTGPYGGGKSSLALVLASLIGNDDRRRSIAHKVVGTNHGDFIQKRLGSGRLVLPVVGRRADPEAAIREAVEALPAKSKRRRGDGSAISALRAIADCAPGGLLIIIDEMGKFLENVAHSGGDVYFFQQLAEEASRSNGKLLVIGILHQAFDDYAHRLAREARNEWLKVQGRFADIPLNIAAEEQIELISRAIEVEGDKPGSGAAKKLATAMNRTHADGLAEKLGDCWPLDPAVACLLGPLSRRRFGQSQRSIFGFLNSAEPLGFQSFLAESQVEDGAVYDLPRLWNYLRANLEPSILASPDGHRWALAVDALERCEARGGDAEHVDVVKTVALMDLFKERSGLSASADVLKVCLPLIKPARMKEVLGHLADWSVVIHKRHLGAFAIYAGSDFDIESAVIEARGKMTGLDFARLKSVAMLQPILAKRFYHKTGALIWFDVDIAPLSNGVEIIHKYQPARGSAGLFLLLIGTEGETDQKARKIAGQAAESAKDFPAAVGRSHDNYSIREAATELLALEAVRAGRSELSGDAVARREVDARIARSAADLEDKLREAFADASWVANVKDADDKPIRASSEDGSVTLNLMASKLADAFFHKIPHIQNELLNRIKPSSNANAAQKLLLRAMVERPSEPRLGIDGYPAEGGLYAALIERTGLHVPDTGRPGAFHFVTPDPANPSRLHGLWEAAQELFTNAGSKQISMTDVFDVWRSTPFGVRDGLLPVLGMAFILSHLSKLSIYLDTVYQVKLSTMLIDRLAQDSGSVRLRWNELSDLQRTALIGLTEVVAKHGGFGPEFTCPTALDTAKGLVKLVNELPNWVLRTTSLPATATQIRNLAKTANDPDKFLLDDLPAVMGDAKDDDGTRIAGLVNEGLESLLAAYPALLYGLETVMLQELRVRGRSQECLDDLRERASVIKGLTGNYRLDALATRLATYEFAENGSDGIEGIASLAGGKPARDWVDKDVDHARIELAALAQEFVKAEGFAHVKGREDRRVNLAIYTSDWRKDAPVKAEFDVTSSDDGKIAALVKEIRDLFSREGVGRDVALAVVAELGANAVHEPATTKKTKRKIA